MRKALPHLPRLLASALCAALVTASVPSAAWAAASREGGGPKGPEGPAAAPAPALPAVPALPAASVPALETGAAGLPGAPAAAALEPVVPVPPAPAAPAAGAAAPNAEPIVPVPPAPAAAPQGQAPARLAGAVREPIVPVPPAPAAPAPDYAGHLAAFDSFGHIGNPSRIGRLFLEADAAFKPRAAEEAPEDLTGDAVPQGDLRAARPRAGLGVPEAVEGLAPQAEVPGPSPRRSVLKSAAAGLGSVAVLFVAALVVQQVGIEAQGAAMPALLQKTFGDFSVIADITILASLGSILGRVLGPLVVDRFSLKRGYMGALTIKVAVNTLLAVLLANGLMTVPLFAVFYAASGLLSGVAMTAEKAIAPAIVGQSQEKLENFGAWKQTLLEIVGSLGPIVTGALVASLGFVPILVAFPIAFALSIAMLWKWLKIPEKLETMRLAALAEAGRAKGGIGSVFKQFFSRIAQGARVVWREPSLKYSFLAFTAYMMLNPFLYTVLAPAYANRLLGADSPLMAGVYGMLTGLYSAGGLVGGLLMLAEQKRLRRAQKGEGGKPPVPPAEIEERLRKSMLRWMLLGTLGLLAIATLALPLPALGSLVALPHWLAWLGTLTLPALALIPFGVAQVVANIKQENYFVSRLPEKDLNNAIGFLGAASLLISTFGLVGLKFLFTGRLPFGWQPFASFAGLSGFTPFVVLAVAMIPLALFYLYLTRKLAKASAPKGS